MRLSLPSVAILSIFAASSHAFAPPKPSFTRTSTTHLGARGAGAGAGSELSGLLTEYSGSATSEAASTATVAAKVAPPAEVTESAVDSVMKAAGAAQDAADQASAAAAAVATKTAVATKAAAATKAVAVAGGTIAGGAQLGGVIVPTKGGIVQVDPSKITYDNQFDASARAKENLALMKANLIGGAGGGGGGGGGSNVVHNVPKFHGSLPKFDGGSIDTANLTPAVANIIAALHLQEYGGWYAAIAMAIIASKQRAAGKEEASAEFEVELTKAQGKANEAASAAGLAAKGANTAKKLAMKMENDMKKNGGSALLESSRAKMVATEKVIMENQMRALQAEVSILRSQLEKARGGKKTTKKKSTKKTEIEEEYPIKMIVDAGVDEDGRIIEILKEIDEENKAKQAAEHERKREEEAKYVKEQKLLAESKAMTKGVEAAQKKAEAAKKKATKKSAKKGSAKKASPKKKASTKKTATKKTSAKKAVEKKVVAAPSAVEKKVATAPPAVEKKVAAPSAVEKKVATAPSAVEKKVATAPPSVEKKVAAPSAVNSDDWASLADSTLKRKTVAQITDYLSGKGVTLTKGMKKAELVEAVRSL